MPKITAIKKQEKRAGRVNIFIDDVFAVGISEKLLIDFDLFKGKELTSGELIKLKEAESVSKCLDKAYRFLSFRQRSEHEMWHKLAEKFDEAVVEQAIETLKKYDYINDRKFATFWIENRKMGRGKKALSFELKNKGIEKELIESSTNNINREEEIESALVLVSNKKKYRGLSGDEAYRKIGGFLSRRGYSYDVIKEVIKKT